MYARLIVVFQKVREALVAAVAVVQPMKVVRSQDDKKRFCWQRGICSVREKPRVAMR